MIFILLWIIGGVCAQEKILGGRLANEGEFPFVGVLRGGTYCMVTIITDTKVLTTGTCLLRDGKPIDASVHYVVAGIIKLVKEPKDDRGQKRKLLSFKIHEEYDIGRRNVKVNDIAVIEVAEPFIMTLYVSTAPFLTGDKETILKTIDDFFASEENNCTSVSFGSTKPVDGEPTKKLEDLRVIDLFPWPRGKCVDILPSHRILNGQEVCTSSKREGVGLCYGEAGAPLICDGKVFAIFTTTDTKKCGGPNVPQFYVIVGIFFKYFGLGSSSHLALSPFTIILLLTTLL